MRPLALLALCCLALAATGCLAVSTLDHQPTPTPRLSDREDCGEILGTAFRSADEQAWFSENCSGWARATLGRIELEGASQAASRAPVDATPAADDGRDGEQTGPPSSQRGRDGDAARCARMQGRPYESAADRRWFLANCLQSEAVPGEPAECAAIRGRPYESPSQRAWFLRNCTASSPAAQDPDPDGPDRQDCDQIRGTRYRSTAEMRWYRQNCTQP